MRKYQLGDFGRFYNSSLDTLKDSLEVNSKKDANNSNFYDNVVNRVANIQLTPEMKAARAAKQLEFETAYNAMSEDEKAFFHRVNDEFERLSVVAKFKKVPFNLTFNEVAERLKKQDNLKSEYEALSPEEKEKLRNSSMDLFTLNKAFLNSANSASENLSQSTTENLKQTESENLSQSTTDNLKQTESKNLSQKTISLDKTKPIEAPKKSKVGLTVGAGVVGVLTYLYMKD